MTQKLRCRYCPQLIDPRGYPSHVASKHSREVAERFASNPLVQVTLAVLNLECAAQGLDPKCLPPAPESILNVATAYDEALIRLGAGIKKYGITKVRKWLSQGVAPSELQADLRRLTDLEIELSIREPTVWFEPVWQVSA